MQLNVTHNLMIYNVWAVSHWWVAIGPIIRWAISYNQSTTFVGYLIIMIISIYEESGT